jgi:hypothetical protein
MQAGWLASPVLTHLRLLQVLVSGVGISVWEGNSQVTAHGITLCILGTISNGAYFESQSLLATGTQLDSVS